MEGTVVVEEKTELYWHEPTQCYVARLPSLGLTVYGETEEYAAKKLRVMFTIAVQMRRERGVLAAWLDKSGVNWRWKNPV